MDAREALERFIDWAVRDRKYLAMYVATVERQHDDGSVDLLPDDVTVRGTGFSTVPIRHGLPGVDVRVVVGSRVLLGFADADPRKPYAALWDRGSIESINFDGGEAPIARVGDPVACYWPASVPVTGTIAGSPFTGTMTITSPGAGVIESGAPRVKA